MSTNQTLQPFAARAIRLGGAAFLTMLTFSSAQTPAVPREQAAPATPVNLAAAAIETALPVASAEVATTQVSAAKADATEKQINDYTAQIGNGLKERERRLTLLNEAMMKLCEAGEMEDAGRVEERIRALLEMPAPSQAGTKMKTEIDHLRAKNDDLALQVLALQEELKRYRPANASNGTRNKGVASADR